MAINGFVRQTSPKRKLESTDSTIKDERPTKKRSPSPSVEQHSFSPVSATGSNGKQAIALETRSSRIRAHSKQSSVTGIRYRFPRRALSTRPSSPIAPPAHLDMTQPRDGLPEEEQNIVIAMANQVEYESKEGDEEEQLKQLVDQARKRKEKLLEAMREKKRMEEQTKQQAVAKSKVNTASKKKRLAAARREQEKAAHEKQLAKAQDEYKAYLEALQSVSEIRLSDDDAQEDRVRTKDSRFKIKDGVRVREREIEPAEIRLPIVAEISEDWEQKVKAALAVRSDTTVLCKSVEGVELSRKDIGRLHPPGQLVLGSEPWLNDEVINAWYANLCARLNEKDGYVKGPNNIPRWVAYSTAWYKSASEKGPQAIQNWSRRKGIKNEKLLETERIFFPTNSLMHWTLLTISGKNRTIEYLDSLNDRGYNSKRYIGLAQAWLKMELGAKYKEEEWEVLHTKSALQNNANDCGVFACLNGLALVKGGQDPSIEFGAQDIPLGRRMFIATLLNGGFQGDFDL